MKIIIRTFAFISKKIYAKATLSHSSIYRETKRKNHKVAKIKTYAKLSLSQPP